LRGVAAPRENRTVDAGVSGKIGRSIYADLAGWEQNRAAMAEFEVWWSMRRK
jgi:hypothetical protein